MPGILISRGLLDENSFESCQNCLCLHNKFGTVQTVFFGCSREERSFCTKNVFEWQSCFVVASWRCAAPHVPDDTSSWQVKISAASDAPSPSRRPPRPTADEDVDDDADDDCASKSGKSGEADPVAWRTKSGARLYEDEDGDGWGAPARGAGARAERRRRRRAGCSGDAKASKSGKSGDGAKSSKPKAGKSVDGDSYCECSRAGARRSPRRHRRVSLPPLAAARAPRRDRRRRDRPLPLQRPEGERRRRRAGRRRVGRRRRPRGGARRRSPAPEQ